MSYEHFYSVKKLTAKPDFDGSARRMFADELSFRWKRRLRIEVAFEHEAKRVWPRAAQPQQSARMTA